MACCTFPNSATYSNEGYQTFITKAANGRDMEVSEINAAAGGRIWSGLQARENGLVDAIGGLDDAVAIAAAAAGLDDDQYRLRYYPPQKSIWEELLSDFGLEIVKISDSGPVFTTSVVMPNLSSNNSWALKCMEYIPMEPVMVNGWATIESQAIAM